MEEVCITVRPCSENGDLGEIAQSFFIVQDGAVLLTNENGKPHGALDMPSKMRPRCCPGRRIQVVIMSVPHKRHRYGALVGSESVDLHQKSSLHRRRRSRDQVTSPQLSPGELCVRGRIRQFRTAHVVQRRPRAGRRANQCCQLP